MIAIASLVSEIWLATDRQTYTLPDLIYVNLLKTLKTKQKQLKKTR